MASDDANPADPTSTADTVLLQQLGAVARLADPVPGYVRELGRAAFDLHQLDAELAELVEDSDVALSGVRSASSDVRLLTFNAGELVVEAQVSGTGEAHTVLGQVLLVTSPEGAIRLETSGLARADVPLDDLGAFRFDGVASGTVRLIVELADGQTVATRWFSL
jgi:hypothetical protein